MEPVKLLFSSESTALSWVTRKFLNSRWSHVSIVHEDSQSQIESYPFRGVIERDLSDLQGDKLKWALVEFLHPDPDALLAAARTQLGKPYDVFGALGVGFRRNWQENDRWFCSELIAYAFQESGHPLFRPESLYRISPEDLWTLPFQVVATNVRSLRAGRV